MGKIRKQWDDFWQYWHVGLPLLGAVIALVIWLMQSQLTNNATLLTILKWFSFTLGLVAVIAAAAGYCSILEKMNRNAIGTLDSVRETISEDLTKLQSQIQHELRTTSQGVLTYSPPAHLMRRVIIPNPNLSEALQGLVESHWITHQAGERPIINHLKLVINARVLDTGAAEQLGLPTTINTIRAGDGPLEWMEVEMKETSRWEGPKDAHPFKKVLVCMETAYAELCRYGLLPQETAVFFPIPWFLARIAAPETQWKQETPLRLLEIDDLKIQIANAKRNLSDPKELPKAQVASKDITRELYTEDFDRMPEESRRLILDGMLDLWHVGNLGSEQGEWEFVFNRRLRMPTGLQCGDKQLWDQKWFVVPFENVCTSIDVEFSVASPLSLDEDRKPWPNTHERVECGVEAAKATARLSDGKYVYPGETLTFWWQHGDSQ